MTQTISITLPDEDYDLIKRYCIELDIKISGFMRKCAKQHIEAHIQQVNLR